MGQSYSLNAAASVTLDAAGTGTCWVSPEPYERWHITRVAVLTNDAPSATTVPVCKVYLGGADPSNFLDGTFSGSADSTDEDVWLEKGQQLTAVWSGGISGSVATLSVFGTRENY